MKNQSGFLYFNSKINTSTILHSLHRRNQVGQRPHTSFLINRVIGRSPHSFPVISERNEGLVKSGFLVLELIMVIAISAIIMTSLFEIYNQVARNMNRVDRFVFEDTQILTLKNRLGKDLAGLSAVWFSQADMQKNEETEQQNKSDQENILSSQYFYSINKQSNLDMLTFVTTSALQSYGTNQDQFVRVVYKIEPDPRHEKMLRLMRKETAIVNEYIDEKTLQQGKFYELVAGIASLEMTYQLIDKVVLKQHEQARSSKDKDGGQSGKEQATQKELKSVLRSVKQWTGDTNKKKNKKQGQKDVSAGMSVEASGEVESLTKAEGDQEQDQQENLGGASTPKFVEMKIIFGATDKQSQKEYKLNFYIPSTVDNAPKAIKKSEPAKTKLEDKSSSLADKTKPEGS